MTNEINEFETAMIAAKDVIERLSATAITNEDESLYNDIQVLERAIQFLETDNVSADALTTALFGTINDITAERRRLQELVGQLREAGETLYSQGYKAGLQAGRTEEPAQTTPQLAARRNAWLYRNGR